MIIKFCSIENCGTIKRDSYQVVFKYSVDTDDGLVKYKFLDVIITDVLLSGWRPQINSSDDQSNYKLNKLLFYVAIEGVIEKLVNGTAKESEEVKLAMSNNSGEIPYEPDTLPNLERFERKIEI